MRLRITKSKNVSIYYVIKTIYVDKKQKTKTIERLGTEEEVVKKANGQNPITWAKKYIEELNIKEKEESLEIIQKLSPERKIQKDSQNLFNAGYLFLQKIYHELKLDEICDEISSKYRFKYDLDSILSRLVYTRILHPSSKLSSFEASKKFIEQPNFKLEEMYRALKVIAKETEFIEAEVYKNSLDVVERNTNILYYDCTNYFFETEEADGLKQYGPSKEHRNTPIVQMGLFMDGNGFPLAFVINPGNTNEQVTLKPLEKQIIKDFKLSKFIVCTDAGLASNENRKFNNIQNRSFIVTQSLKKIKGHIKEWALSKDGWYANNSKKDISLNSIDNSSTNDEVYYKERWIKENGIEQRLIVSYSPKYATYQKNIRDTQIARAEQLVNNPSKASKRNLNDPKRFITTTNITSDGEVAEKKVLSLNQKAIDDEAIYDGFYAVCTTLEDDISEIIKVNKRRWEIEESFRILKTEFKSRPVYVTLDECIKAHFTTCFLSLLVYRILENKLDEKFTATNIIQTLRDFNMLKINGEGYIPAFTRTDTTDYLHDKFGFRLDTEIVTNRAIKKILNSSKK